jgi:hypothetical protein
MRERVLMIVLLCALVLAAPALAQPAVGGVWLYTEIAQPDGSLLAQVIHIGPDAQAVVYPLPKGFVQEPCPGGERPLMQDAVISPDGRYLAAAFQDCTLQMVQPLIVADVLAGACCISIPMPLSGLPVTAVDLGGIDPASGLLSYSYVSQVDAGGSGGPPVSGGLAVASIFSGADVYLLDMPSALSGIPDAAAAPWAFVDGWQAGSVRFSETCYACEPQLEGEWRLWNPQTGTVAPFSGAYYSAWADVLPSTGEMLYATQLPTLPVSSEPSMFPQPNAIVYLAGGAPPSAASAVTLPPVYIDTTLSLPLFGGAHWVQDGASFVVSLQGESWEWRNRSGEGVPVKEMSGAAFVAGTAFGWLASTPLETGGHALLAYQPTADSVTSTMLFYGGMLDVRTSTSGYRVLYAAPLAGTGYPPPVVVQAGPQPSPVCDGFTPLLQVGMTARVTEGSPNRLRDAPSRSGQVIDLIPGGATVTVLGGPFCIEGIAFWQVEYRGKIGFTAEGAGSDYFLIADSMG